MPAIYISLLSMAFLVGWTGTRNALYLRHAKHGRRDEIFMLVVCWTPLLVGLVALLLTLSGSNS